MAPRALGTDSLRAHMRPTLARALARLFAHLGILVVGAMAILVFVMGATAQAQDAKPTLVSITPGPGAELDQSPETIELVFSAALKRSDVLVLAVACPEVIPLDQPEYKDSRTRVVYKVATTIDRGACSVKWRLVDADGVELGQMNTAFSVKAAAPATTAGATTTTTVVTPGATAAPTTIAGVVRQDVDSSQPVQAATAATGDFSGAVWLGRLVSSIGIMTLFGAIALIGTGWTEGTEYLITIKFFRIVWLISVVGSLLYIVSYSAAFTGGSLGSGMNPAVWLDLIGDGWVGAGAVLRLASVLLCAYVALYPERIVEPQTASLAWILPAIAVTSVAMTRVGGPAALVGLVVAIVHVLAAAVWFGGAALIGRVVLAGPGEEDLVVATRTYARLSTAAIALTIATGIIEMIRQTGGSLFSTGFGQVLLLKVIAVAAMMFVALAARQQVNARLDRAHEMSPGNANRFRRAYGTEMMIGLVVLALSGWMVSLSPGSAVPWSGENYVRAIEYPATTGIDATVQIGPAKVGRNGYLIQVRQPTTGITSLMLRFRPPDGTQNGQAFIVEDTVPLTGAGSAWRATEIGIPIGVPGTWRVELIATTATGGQIGAVGTFSVAPSDGAAAITVSPTGLTTTPPSLAVQVVETTPVTGALPTTSTTTLAPATTGG